MSNHLHAVRDAALAALGDEGPAADLVDWVSAHFPDPEAYREGDDLVIRRGGHFLIARRVGADRFRVSENVQVPSTNLVDFGGGEERTLDQLIAEIASSPL